MKDAKISIIIPTYNRAHLIWETLESVMNQTYTNWECLVVDDGSDDYTKELIDFYCEKDSRIKFLKRIQLPKGASHCRNIGIENAKGEFCIFLDSDDLLLDFCLNSRMECAFRFPENKFWVFPMFSEDGGKLLKEVVIPTRSSYLEGFLSNKIYWGIMCTFWEINFLKSLNGFNIYYPRLNDPEIHIRAMLAEKNNYKVLNSLPADSIHRWALDMFNIKEFSAKYYHTQILFIPTISTILIDYNEKSKLPLLIGYLGDYMKLYSNNLGRSENNRLIHLYYKNRIIGFNKYILLVLFYNFLIILKRFHNKSKLIFNQLLEL